MFKNFWPRLIRKAFGQTLIFNRGYFIPIIREIVKENYDYVLVENRTALIPILTKYLKETKAKVFIHIHNVDQIKPNFTVDLTKQCDGVIAVSEYVKDLVIKSYPNIDSRKITVIHNFSDIKEIESPRIEKFKDDFFEAHGIGQNSKVVLYSGRVIASKGIMQLINALVSINRSDVFLLIIGGSWYGEQVKSDFEKRIEINSERMANKAIFTGYIPHQEMAKYYSLADICVFPSIAPETAGLVQLEAMSFRKMTVVSSSGGMPEYIGKDGEVVELGKNFQQRLTEVLEKLLGEDRDELQKKGQKLYQHSLLFSKATAFKELMDSLD